MYEVELDLVDGPRGRLLVAGGICGCPLGGDCKHVAAVCYLLAESFALSGGTLDYTLAEKPVPAWGADRGDAPPSFGPQR